MLLYTRPCYVVHLCAIRRGLASMAVALRHRHWSITYSSKCCYLQGGKSQLTGLRDKILDLECNFRKLASLAMLQSHIRILHASLLQIDTEMTAKYGNKRYTVNSHWKTCRRLCVSINRPRDLDLWPGNYYTSRIEGGTYQGYRM